MAHLQKIVDMVSKCSSLYDVSLFPLTVTDPSGRNRGPRQGGENMSEV